LILALGCDPPAERDVPTSASASPSAAPAASSATTPEGWREPIGVGEGVVRGQACLVADGTLLAAWEAMVDGAPRLVVAEMQPSGWKTRAPAEKLTGGSRAVSLACGERALVVWQQGDPRESSVRWSERRAPDTWSSPQRLSFAPAAYQPYVAMAADGEVFVSWAQTTSKRVGLGLAVARRAPGASAFERPRDAHDVVSIPSEFVNDGRVALAGGAALVTWYQSTGGPLHVYATARAKPGEALTPPREDAHLSPLQRGPEGYTGRYLGEVRAALAPSGARAVVWTQPVSDGARLYAAFGEGRFGKHSGEAFAGSGIVLQPAVVFGQNEELYVTWQEIRPFVHVGDDGLWLVQRGRDGSWKPSARSPLRLSSLGIKMGESALAAWRRGALVVWSEQTRGGGPWRIMLREVGARASEQGGPAGASEARRLSQGGDARLPVIHVTGESAVVSWRQDGKLRVSVSQ
jgi:hypothetical protein